MSAVLGVILARGGSKRIPRKNMRLLHGSPLVAWTIIPALTTETLDGVVVSSDDDEILSVARYYGALPLQRPDELASDDASSYDALLHVLDATGLAPEYVCLLQPTSPLRHVLDIEACIALVMEAESAPAVVSVEEGHTAPNGAVYVGRVDWMRDALARGITHPFDGEAVERYEMPAARSVDIDTEDDWRRVEAIVNGMHQGYRV